MHDLRYGMQEAAVILLTIILSIATFQRNSAWESDVTFWSDVAVKSPEKARTHNNLGSAMMNAGRCDDAIPSLRLSINADPLYIESHYNLAACYIKKGSFDEAVPELEETLRINSILKKGHYGAEYSPRYEMLANSNLGNIYYMKGMLEKAVFHYKGAVNVYPEDTSTHFNLAMTYEAMGMMKEARSEFEEVLKIDPSDEGAKRGIKRLLGM